MIHVDAADFRRPPPVFGRWLLTQTHRTDAVGQLAQAATGDRRFPKDGDPAAVSRHLNEQQVEGDVHQALEDAELDWLCR